MKTFCPVLLTILMIGAFVSPMHADETNSLVGRFDYCRTDAYYVRFGTDGTFRLVTESTFLEGRYRVLSGSVIEFNIGLPNGTRRTNEIKYRMTGDTLKLKVDGCWRTFKRAN